MPPGADAARSTMHRWTSERASTDEIGPITFLVSSDWGTAIMRIQRN